MSQARKQTTADQTAWKSNGERNLHVINCNVSLMYEKVHREDMILNEFSKYSMNSPLEYYCQII